MTAAIGHLLPPGVTATALMRQLDRELEAEAQAARDREAARAAEEGAKRRQQLDALQARWKQHVDSYELMRDALAGLIEEMLETGEALASMRAANPAMDDDFLAINIPTIATREQYRQRSFTTTQALIHQRAAERSKRDWTRAAAGAKR
jgi:hypothetical protein